MRACLHDNGWIVPVIVLTLATFLVCFALFELTGFSGQIAYWNRLTLAFTIIGIVGVGRLLFYLLRLLRSGVESPIAAIAADWPKAVPSIVIPVLGILMIGLFANLINLLKVMITRVVPFWADGPLMAFDLAVFGNIEAGAAMVQPAMPAIGFFYWTWHLINIVGIVWVLHWKERQSRLIVAYCLTWVIGMVFAYLGSSAGPMFIGAYDPRLAPHIIQEASTMLWNNHLSGGAAVGGGISAFPSMHVAIAVWFAFVLRERGLFALGLTYAAGIWICSVLLGWHYSLDGLGGLLVAVAAYYLTGPTAILPTPIRGPVWLEKSTAS